MNLLTVQLVEIFAKDSTEAMLNKAMLIPKLSAYFEENKKHQKLFESCIDSRIFFHALYLTNINEILFLRYKVISDLVSAGAPPSDAHTVADGVVGLAENIRGTDLVHEPDESHRILYEKLSYALRDYDRGNYKPALVDLSKLSTGGMDEAHYYLGKFFFDGKAVKADASKAVQCFQKGDAAGVSSAKYYLARCFLKGLGVTRNTEKGIELLKEAADMGQEDAVFAAGCMYRDGSGGFKQDIKKAIEYLQKAADYGNWSAAIMICDLYFEDAKTTGNFHKTSVARQRIQDVKDPEACFKIAQIYERGIGVAPNIEKALNFSAKAAAKGYPGATEMMTRLGNKKLGR